MTLPRNVLLHGSAGPLPERTPVHAGPFSMIYTEGEIRYVYLAGREVLRRIYVAVRDANWSTIPSRVIKTDSEILSDSFRITVQVESKLDEIDFHWKNSITGDARGQIVFRARGVARSTFQRNRVGLCVLFGASEYMGIPCVIDGVDGKKHKGFFPEFISPHQPFQQIAGLSCAPFSDGSLKLRLRGDIFEMEDQRNWGDASFKLYSTPLDLDIPVLVEKGTVISQAVTVKQVPTKTALTTPAYASNNRTEPILITFRPEERHVLPRIGLGYSGWPHSSNSRALQLLRKVGPSHLRVDVRLNNGDRWEHFQNAVWHSHELGIPLELALYVSAVYKAELRSFAELVQKYNPLVCSILVFDSQSLCTDPVQLNYAREQLSSMLPAAMLGGGTDKNFAELNRAHRSFLGFDLLACPYTPQIHSTDSHSLIENLDGLGAIAHSVKNIAPHLPIAFSPITLKPRYLADNRPNESIDPTQAHPQTDSRQFSLFGAGITLGILKQLAEAGIYSATCFDATGPRGLMGADLQHPTEESVVASESFVYPLFHVFADVLSKPAASVISTHSSSSHDIQSLCLQQADKKHLYLANCSPHQQRIRIGASGVKDAQLKCLDESNVAVAMSNPEEFMKMDVSPIALTADSPDLCLERWAIARISWPDSYS